MRRILLTALASSAIAVALPVAASAHGKAGHHARQERVHHHRHHARFVHFASRSLVTSQPGTTTGSPKTPTPTAESVGTIASFEGGVLKITLNDGTTVSGTVTEGTEIKCATPTAMVSDNNGGPSPSGSSGHDNGQEEDGEGQGHDEGQSHDEGHGNDEGQSHDEGQSDDQGQGDDEGHGLETTQECGAASLVAGAKVQEAELKLSGGQASWQSVELAG